MNCIRICICPGPRANSLAGQLGYEREGQLGTPQNIYINTQMMNIEENVVNMQESPVSSVPKVAGLLQAQISWKASLVVIESVTTVVERGMSRQEHGYRR